MFRAANTQGDLERENRRGLLDRKLRLGVESVDDALGGITNQDLILIGAGSGGGKTQFCCNIALANMIDEKKVHYIALEAGEYEIERRLKYQLVAEMFFSDPNRPRLPRKLRFSDWALGAYLDELKVYEDQAQKFFEAAFKDLWLLYKTDKFGITELIQSVLWCAKETDLIIIDHVHYFDFDDDNENRAIKEIAKTVRSLVLEQNIPIILVAHIRKSDRRDDSLCPGLEDFHGSSDLYKIATKAVTFSSGRPTENGLYETHFRFPKNRFDGSVTRYMSVEYFNPKTGRYENGKYKIGWAEQKRSKGFEPIDRTLWPDWARKFEASAGSGNHPYNPSGGIPSSPGKGRPGYLSNVPWVNQGK